MGEFQVDEKSTPLATVVSASSRSPTLAPQDQQRVLPLCAACTASMPTLDNLLDNERIQQSLVTFNEAMANLSWSVPQVAGPTKASESKITDIDQSQARPQAAPCSLCAAKQAIPIITTLMMEVKAVKKDKTVSKSEKKALKGEIKGQMWEVRRNFKKEWKTAKQERK